MDPFLLKLLLSIVVGGAWITVASMLAERLGSKVGGFVAGLPSTIVVALFFMAWTQGPELVYAATASTPLGFALNVVYAVAFAALSPQGLAAGVGAAFLGWFGLSIVAVLVGLKGFEVLLGVWVITMLAGYLVMQHVLHVRARPGFTVRYSGAALCARALFAGGVIGLAVALSRVAGPLWGGIFAAFPAVYTSTMVIVSRSAGVQFARSIAPSLMISGGVIPIVYAVVFRYAILRFGLAESVALSYAGCLPVAWLSYLFIRRRLR